MEYQEVRHLVAQINEDILQQVMIQDLPTDDLSLSISMIVMRNLPIPLLILQRLTFSIHGIENCQHSRELYDKHVGALPKKAPPSYRLYGKRPTAMLRETIEASNRAARKS
jgi:hypothetical protein